ncbi:hypothetical protein FQN60_015509 [Etheostoma spectabile]|uniref:Sugar phosphate transporter domain-containing protein n=1 Tax=Etheostoma spectabile TaxID=54343 RepID=A0A5J5CQ63_9PERO|nr:hypothetical protein FQN60_015509 [Etheostoma spectabile]
MDVFKSRFLGIAVAVAHGFFSGSLNILLKFLISNYNFNFLTLIQLLTSSTAAFTLEVLRRLGWVKVPPFSVQLSKEFGPVCILSTLQSTLTLWSLRGLSLPMYVVFKRCLPLFTLSIGMCVLRNGVPSPGVKTCHDSEYGALTAQYAIAVMATPVLLVCSVISLDAVNMWTYEGWQNPYITVVFVICVFIGCAMNFTTLHCTYINSAVTTSFVGVVKSIATITVGMLAFSDVAPTHLFIGGVVVNTIGSITYCIVKYFETKKKSLYEDLEEAAKDGAPPGEPHTEKPPLDGDGPAAGIGSDPERPEIEGGLISDRKEDVANGDVPTGDVAQRDGEAGVNSRVMTEDEVLAMQREHLNKENAANATSVSDSYVGVWRSIRHLQFMKKDPLIENMEQQSP